MFTVKDLIKKLQSFPEDCAVFVDGYEGGLSDIQQIKMIGVRFNVNTESYYGPHEEDQKSDRKAVFLERDINPLAE